MYLKEHVFIHVIYDLILNIPVYSENYLYVTVTEIEPREREREVKQKSTVAKMASL